MSQTSVPTQKRHSAEKTSVESAHWSPILFHRLIDRATLSALDRCYWAFVENLPSPPAQLATARRTLTGREESEDLHTVVAGIGLIVALPWMFRDAFPRLSEEQLLNVGQAWTFLAAAGYVRDHMADGQVPRGPDVDELLEQLTSKACDVFRSLLNNQAEFWKHFDRYEQQAVSALESEAVYRKLPNTPYNLDVARQIAVGKSAPINVPICAMAVLCEEMSLFPKLERSMGAWVAGRQLYDDTIDWKEDLARGHYTYPLIQAISQSTESGMPISPETIEAEIYNSTIREDTLRHSKAAYQEALSEVEGIPCQDWIEFVTYCQGDTVGELCRLILRQISVALSKEGEVVS